MNQEELNKSMAMSCSMRKRIIQMAYHGNGNAHLGSGLSIVDIMAVLYGCIMKYDRDNPYWEDRDRFILSKGHGVLGYYTALAAAGIMEDGLLDTFQQNGSDLISHPVMNLPLGIEASNGSLGHGLSMAVGIALAARKKRKNYKTYVLLGNGECNEGSVWEAAMLASSLKLDHLVAVIDHNRYQSDGLSKDILDMGDLAAKWSAFGWKVIEADGHSHKALYEAFQSFSIEKPMVIIADTVKGKGISFMENNNEWHHNRLTKELYEKALSEIEVS